MLKRQWHRRRWWWQLQYRIPNTFCKFILLCFGGWMFFFSFFSIFQRPKTIVAYEYSLALFRTLSFLLALSLSIVWLYITSSCISLSLFFIFLILHTLTICVCVCGTWCLAFNLRETWPESEWLGRGEWVLHEIVLNFLFLFFCCSILWSILCSTNAYSMLCVVMESTCITMACY